MARGLLSGRLVLEDHMKGPRPKSGYAILDILQGVSTVRHRLSSELIKTTVKHLHHGFSSEQKVTVLCFTLTGNT